MDEVGNQLLSSSVIGTYIVYFWKRLKRFIERHLHHHNECILERACLMDRYLEMEAGAMCKN